MKPSAGTTQADVLIICHKCNRSGYIQRNCPNTKAPNQNYGGQRQRTQQFCRKCDRLTNHSTAEHRNRNQIRNKGSANIVENTVLMVTEILGARVDENAWVIDSACTSHVTNQIDALLNA